MIDLDSPNTDPAVVMAGIEFMSKVKQAVRIGERYDVVEIYRKVVPMKGNCIHSQIYVQLECLVLADGTGLMTERSMANLADAQRTKCEECYIKQYANYTEMHGFPIFEGTIEQIRYANKVRAKAHMKHGEAVDRAITNITEAGWWLDNSNRTPHAKIWREVNEATQDEVSALNEEYRLKRERREENRFKQAMREDARKNK